MYCCQWKTKENKGSSKVNIDGYSQYSWIFPKQISFEVVTHTEKAPETYALRFYHWNLETEITLKAGSSITTQYRLLWTRFGVSINIF